MRFLCALASLVLVGASAQACDYGLVMSRFNAPAFDIPQYAPCGVSSSQTPVYYGQQQFQAGYGQQFQVGYGQQQFQAGYGQSRFFAPRAFAPSYAPAFAPSYAPAFAPSYAPAFAPRQRFFAPQVPVYVPSHGIGGGGSLFNFNFIRNRQPRQLGGLLGR